jgi:hypothetical protein
LFLIRFEEQFPICQFTDQPRRLPVAIGYTCTALPKVLALFQGVWCSAGVSETRVSDTHRYLFVWIYFKKSRLYHLSSGKAASICHCPLQGHESLEHLSTT